MAKKTKTTVTVKIIEKSIRKNREIDDDPFAELTPARFKTFKGIKDSREHLGVAHALYVRQLLHAGRIEGVKVQCKGYTKWFIDPASIDYYNGHKATRTGLRRYTLKINASDEEAVRYALDALDIEFSLELSYKKKGS